MIKPVQNQVRNHVRDQVGRQMWSLAREVVEGRVWVQVGHQNADQVKEQVWDQLLVQVRDQLKAKHEQD